MRDSCGSSCTKSMVGDAARNRIFAVMTSSGAAPPESRFTSDPLWRVAAYRLALEMASVVWSDTALIVRDVRARSVADQLTRAVGSIGANIAEGYGRGGGRDRARFYEYALGSAREARHWYCMAGRLLPSETLDDRIDRLGRIARLLSVMVRSQRGRDLWHERESS